MEGKPRVYYRPARSYSSDTGLVADLLAVFDAAGFPEMIRPGDVVAIKLHCGEWNNTAYLRPVYARTLADRVKELGGRPFVTDTTTLTYGVYASRSSALDILLTAERNGFTSATLGCPFVVADGCSGRDDVRVEVPEGVILKEAYVAAGVAAADVLIALSHFKGHAVGMIGGAIKNLGIGAQSQRGKHNVHMGGHPRYGLGAATDFHPERCKGRRGCPVWETCENCCPWGLFHVSDESITWERERCTTCLAHLGANTWCGVLDFPEATWEATNCAMADACLGAVKAVGRERVGFINMAIDVSPHCDCTPYADAPVVPHVGVFASRDAVAVDAATKDLITAGPGAHGSLAEDLDALAPGAKKMEVVAGGLRRVSEDLQINAGVRNGLGQRDYELVEIEPIAATRLRFPPDPRPVRVRYGHRPLSPVGSFPRERHDGRGFDRLDEVDFAGLR